MSKSTPGPWHAWNRGIGFEVHAGPGPCRSATCNGAINDSFRETFEENDARLIAAAPELFEACRQMRREYGAFGKVSQETLMQVDAAIAKATPVDRQKASTDTDVAEQSKEESRSRAAMEAEDCF